jgi:hypothetical protein
MLRIAVDYEGFANPFMWQVARSSTSKCETNSPALLKTRRLLFDIERIKNRIVIKGGCELDVSNTEALENEMRETIKDKSEITGRDLFEVAKLLEAYSCKTELIVVAREEDCLTMDNNNFYLAYKDWKIVASATATAKLGDNEAATRKSSVGNTARAQGV